MTQPQPTSVDAEVYLQLAPQWSPAYSTYWRDAAGNRILEGAKVVRHTLTRPERPAAGTVLVKVTLRLPAGAFLPLQPEAIVVVPDSMIVTTPLEVEATHPGGDEE